MISIHAPLAGRDKWTMPTGGLSHDFNPRAPRGARRGRKEVKNGKSEISIHAPLAGRDWASSLKPLARRYFNPRAPRGARRKKKWKKRHRNKFQSTRPSRGATAGRPGPCRRSGISIHAPLAGRDFSLRLFLMAISYFNPRAPRGARPLFATGLHDALKFQSTRPSRGATASRPQSPRCAQYFNPRAPRGARPGILASVTI